MTGGIGSPDAPRLTRRVLGGVALWTDHALGRHGIHVGFTERAGGVSGSPFGSLNLATHVGDEPEAVEENRRRFLGALRLLGSTGEPSPIGVVTAEQVHGSLARVVGAAEAGDDPLGRDPVPGADGLVTAEPGVALMLLFADCVPVVLVAPGAPRGTGAPAVAVAHAGWRGMADGVVERTMERLCEHASCKPFDLLIYVGPHICGECYEVGRDVLSRFPEVTDTMTATRGALDLATVLDRRLDAIGVRARARVSSGMCTAERTDAFFSYRAEGITGRHAAFAWIRRGPSGR